MKAAVHDRYGPAEVVEVREIAPPKIGDRDILVRVGASSVTTADWRLRAAAFPGAMQVFGRLFAGITAPRRKVRMGRPSGKIDAIIRRKTNP